LRKVGFVDVASRGPTGFASSPTTAGVYVIAFKAA